MVRVYHGERNHCLTTGLFMVLIQLRLHSLVLTILKHIDPILPLYFGISASTSNREVSESENGTSITI